MQHPQYFNSFLRETVNLRESRLTTLGQRVDSIYAAMKADVSSELTIIGKKPQGSWAHRTIINPVGNKEFDADVMICLADNPDWSSDPRQYIDALYRTLKNHPKYGKMTLTRKCRCVRLVYANDFHVDLVPYVEDRASIVNRDDNTWERSDPAGFTDWLREQDTVTGGNLRKVIRLMKYLRDHKNSFTGTRSILLTTMMGERVQAWQKSLDPGYYSDVPTTLLHVVSDLDAWLQANPVKPSIADPSGSGVTFDHRWDQSTYSYFRDRIHTHAAEIDSAYHEQDPDRSVRLWRSLFGDDFAKDHQSATSSGRFSVSAAAPAAALGSLPRSGRAG
jgi:hypothetical protein